MSQEKQEMRLVEIKKETADALYIYCKLNNKKMKYFLTQLVESYFDNFVNGFGNGVDNLREIKHFNPKNRKDG